MQERICTIKLKISIVLMQLWRLQMERGKLRISLGLFRTQRTEGATGRGIVLGVFTYEEVNFGSSF